MIRHFILPHTPHPLSSSLLSVSLPALGVRYIDSQVRHIGLESIPRVYVLEFDEK